MSGPYVVWLTTDAGHRLQIIDGWSYLRYNMIANGVGRLELALPSSFDLSILRVDQLVEIWRTSAFGQMAYEGSYLVRRLVTERSDEGQESHVLFGPDINALLARRIVAYAAGTAQASKTDQADDMMKAIVRENLGSLASDADRDWTQEGLSVAGDAGLGPLL